MPREASSRGPSAIRSNRWSCSRWVVRILLVSSQAVRQMWNRLATRWTSTRRTSSGTTGADRSVRPLIEHGFQDHPQIFVGGEFIGGCTDLFDAFRQGQVQQLMRERASVSTSRSASPYDLLPTWLHPRPIALRLVQCPDMSTDILMCAAQARRATKSSTGLGNAGGCKTARCSRRSAQWPAGGSRTGMGERVRFQGPSSLRCGRCRRQNTCYAGVDSRRDGTGNGTGINRNTRSMAHNDCLLKWFGWLGEAMPRPFLGPYLAHLALDDRD